MMHYDVVIIGGGPAGMAAALSAHQEKASTLLLETEDMLGGILNQCIHNGFGLHYFKEELTGPEYAQRFVSKIEQTSIQVFLNTLVLSVSKNRIITAISKEHGLLTIEAGAVVFATGCRERPRGAIRIPGTRPAGVLTAGTAQKYINMQGYLPGKECVILGSGDIGLIMARRMTLSGMKIKAVVELMPFSSGLERNIVQCLQDFHIPLLLSHTVTRIHGAHRVEGVSIAPVDENLSPIAGSETFLSCDTLLLSVGLIPTIELAQEAGAALAGKAIKVDQHFSTTIPGIFICGNTLHVHDLVDYVTMESSIAGASAAKFALGKMQPGVSFYDISPGRGISYTVPQWLEKDALDQPISLRFRTNQVFKNAMLQLCQGERILASFPRPHMAPGEMQTLSLPTKLLSEISGPISLRILKEEPS